MQKYIALSVLILSCLTAFSQDQFEALRIDYIHSGDAKTQEFSIYRLVAEPYFSGNQNHLIYPFNYGNYKLEVRSTVTGALKYSYHYNTLFNEWQATSMAKTETRSYQESVKIPFPGEESTITFYSRDAGLNWREEYSYNIDPDSKFIIREKAQSLAHDKIHDSGNYKNKMDLVILPDGYTEEEMDKFHDDAKRFKNYLLKCAPFNKHNNKINIWTVDVISEESGTDKPTKNQWRQTALNTSFNTLGSQRYLTPFDHYLLREKAAVTPYDLIFILVNDDLYGGGGIFNFYSISSSDDKYADFLLVHEFGHHFACLGDEYYTSEVAVEDYHKTDVEPLEPNLTTLVDFDSKWKDMMDPETPVPTPVKQSNHDVLGVYEGGGYVAKGVYRPYIDCTMKSAKYDNFCPVCSKAIVEMLKYYTGDEL